MWLIYGWRETSRGRKKKKSESGEAAIVFFGSFLDTKKELGCGAKPHCYAKIIMNLQMNLSRKNKQRSQRSAASSVEKQLLY